MNCVVWVRVRSVEWCWGWRCDKTLCVRAGVRVLMCACVCVVRMPPGFALFEVLAGDMPMAHSWTFDVSPAAGLVVGDLQFIHGADASSGALVYDSMGATVVNGDTSDLGCALGSCMRVTGCGGSLSTTDPLNATAFSGSQPRSISVWVRSPAVTAGFVPLVTLGSVTSPGSSFSLGLLDGVPVARVGAGGAYEDVVPLASAALDSAAWHHLAVTYDSATVRLFIDGQWAGEASVPVFTLVDGDARIVLGGGGARDVAVDEVRVYAFPLSADHVSQLHSVARRCPRLRSPDHGTMSCTGTGTSVGDECSFACDESVQRRVPTAPSRVCLDDGTWSGADVYCVREAAFEAHSTVKQALHWWDFDDVSASLGGNGRSPAGVLSFPDVAASPFATPLQASTASPSIARVLHDVDRPSIGSAVHLKSGSCAEGVHLAAAGSIDSSLASTTPKSLSLWFKATSLGGNGDGVLPLASFGGSRAADDADCSGDAAANCHGARLALRHTGGDGGSLVADGLGGGATSPVSTPTGRWVHAAAVYDGVGGLALYVDGEVVATESVALDVGVVTDDLLRVGRDSLVPGDSSRSCDVTIDDVKVFDYTLSAEEVAAITRTSPMGTSLCFPASLSGCRIS